jgi:transmembrane sensor
MDDKTKASRDDEFQLTEKAGEWLSRLLESDERRTEFFAWLAESPRHVEEFLFVLSYSQDIAALTLERRARIEQLAREIGSSDLLANIVPLTRTALVPVATESSRSGKREIVWHRSSGLRMRWMASAAVMLMVAAGGWWFTAADRWRTYSTEVGQQSTVELRDGSTMHLNTGTKVAVRVDDTTRTVRLINGEAMFHVRHDASRPFLVRSSGTVVQAIGTQFDVYRMQAGTRVSVIEGMVKVSAEAQPAESKGEANPAPTAVAESAAGTSSVQMLGAGERIEVSAQGAMARPEPLDFVKTTAWRQRRLVFEEDSLADIAAEFNRYHRSPQIRVIGEAARNERFSATFNADEPDALERVLAVYPNLIVERTEDEIVVRTRETEDSGRAVQQ